MGDNNSKVTTEGVKQEDVVQQVQSPQLPQLPQRPHMDASRLQLLKGYSSVSVELKKLPVVKIDPDTGKPVPTQQRVFTCDYAMVIIRSDKYDMGTEVFIRANAELSPLSVLNGQIVQAVIDNDDVVATVRHAEVVEK